MYKWKYDINTNNYLTEDLFTICLSKRTLEKLFEKISMIFKWLCYKFFSNVAMIWYSGNYKQIISAQANEKKKESIVCKWQNRWQVIGE